MSYVHSARDCGTPFWLLLAVFYSYNAFGDPQGLTFAAELHESKILVGQPLVATFRVTNNSGKPVNIWGAAEFPEGISLRYRLSSPDLTQPWESNDFGNPYDRPEPPRLAVLDPGESVMGMRFICPKPDYYDAFTSVSEAMKYVPGPGNYQIEFGVYRLGESANFTWTKQPVSFEILPLPDNVGEQELELALRLYTGHYYHANSWGVMYDVSEYAAVLLRSYPDSRYVRDVRARRIILQGIPGRRDNNWLDLRGQALADVDGFVERYPEYPINDRLMFAALRARKSLLPKSVDGAEEYLRYHEEYLEAYRESPLAAEVMKAASQLRDEIALQRNERPQGL